MATKRDMECFIVSEWLVCVIRAISSSSSNADFPLLCFDARISHVSLQSLPSQISHRVDSRIL